MNYTTDIEIECSQCLHCGKLASEKSRYCYRCDSKLYQRKPNSIKKTFLYSLSAIFFLIPANLLTIMDVESFKGDSSGTIIDGVIHFFKTQNYFIGTVIFLASIMIPIVKVSALLFMLLIVKFKFKELAPFATKLYRLIEKVGKYSILDVFVVAIMVSFMQFDNFVTMSIGPAVFPFAIAVISTIFATESFDTRLLWDIE